MMGDDTNALLINATAPKLFKKALYKKANLAETKTFFHFYTCIQPDAVSAEFLFTLHIWIICIQIFYIDFLHLHALSKSYIKVSMKFVII
jgi:hypothetical protein